MHTARHVSLFHAPNTRSGDALITEHAAVSMYVAELNPEAGLAPPIGDPLRGPSLLGDRFSAADVLWGSALDWTMKFKLVPEMPVVPSYLERFNARPAVVRTRASDAAPAAGG